MERENHNPAQRVFDIPDLKNEIYSFVIEESLKQNNHENDETSCIKKSLKEYKERCVGCCCLPCNMYYLFKILINCL